MDRPRPVVHIGYHKTGTTWFQRQFYPRVKNFEYVPQLRVIEAFRQSSVFDFDPAAMRAQLGIDGSKPALICDEALCGHMQGIGQHGSNAWHNAVSLQKMFPDAHIIIFIRAQPDMLASTYGEYVRGGGFRDARDYILPDTNDRQMGLRQARVSRANLTQFEYDRLIAHYDDLFGRGHVHVYAFEQFRMDPTGVAGEIARTCGFEIDPGEYQPKRENPGYGSRLLPIARLFNRFGHGGSADDPPWINIPGWFKFSRNLLHRFNKTSLAGRPPVAEALLGAELHDVVCKQFAASNKRLLKQRDLPLSELGYPL